MTPTPRRLYVHDDLTERAWRAPRDRQLAVRLAATLFDLVRREPHAVVITLPEQLDRILGQGGFPAFAAAVGIGGAGERVARQIHARAGWFPSILRIDVTRVESGDRYVLAGPAPLTQQLANLPSAGPIAIVDDTLFSGITLQGVLTALPGDARRRSRVFCLRGVAASVPAIERLAPVTIGFAAAGRILEDVSFINASGLMCRGAIRRADGPPLAFFERPEWMAAWFPAGAAEITDLCRRLQALVDVAGEPSLGAVCAV
jgi:hypothetical protein